MSLTKDEILDLGAQINEAIDSVTNVEEILADTSQDLM